jgi:hypothetical protein
MTRRICTFGRWVVHAYYHCCMQGFLGIFELSYMKSIRSKQRIGSLSKIGFLIFVA